MAQREGSVYLYLFVVAAVLFLAMTVLFFVDNADKQDVTSRLAQAQSDNKDLEKRLKDLSDRSRELRTLIAGPAAAEAEPWNDEQYRRELADRVAFPIYGVLGTKREYTYLTEPFPDLERLFKTLTDARDTAIRERDRVLDEHMQARKSGEDTLAELHKKHNQTLQELQDLRDRHEDLDNKAKEEKARMLAELTRVEEETSGEIIRLRRRITALDNQRRNVELRLEECERETLKEKSIDDITEDGEIVNILSSTGKAWINLGRKQNLRSGIVFRVYQEGKGGKKHLKGAAEVQKVGEETSEVRISEELDSLDPIVVGDKVSSLFYDPKARPVFVFAGSELETTEVTRGWVESKIEGYGAEIRKGVDINTDFLVAIKNYENSPEYKAARELGVTIIRERDLLEFIGR